MRPLDRALVAVLALSAAALALRPVALPEATAELAGGEPSIAVCAMPTLINELMDSDRFRPAIENVRPELREQLGAVSEEMQDLRDRLQEFDPEDPADQRDAQRFRELNMELDSLRRQLNAAVQRATAAQIAECYELVRSSADAVGEDLGFDYVISTGDPQEALNTDDFNVTLRQITARPVLRFPEGTDITDDVRDDLNLE
jgi:Skp family chaperone for outer membrane proteins